MKNAISALLIVAIGIVAVLLAIQSREIARSASSNHAGSTGEISRPTPQPQPVSPTVDVGSPEEARSEIQKVFEEFAPEQRANSDGIEFKKIAFRQLVARSSMQDFLVGFRHADFTSVGSNQMPRLEKSARIQLLLAARNAELSPLQMDSMGKDLSNLRAVKLTPVQQSVVDLVLADQAAAEEYQRLKNAR